MQEDVEFERKFQAAIAELESAGVKPQAANPLFTRGARALGLRVKPPFYMGFQQLVCFMGLPFGVFWGLFMYVFLWRGMTVSIAVILGSIILAALVFGFIMAWFITSRRKMIEIRDWDAL